MVIAHHPCYAHSLPANHRFPMEKYDLLHGQLHLEGFGHDAMARARCHDHLHHSIVTRLNIGRCFAKDRGVAQRNGGRDSPGRPLWWNRESIIMSGTLECALEALQGGVGLNIAGGTHHAFADRAEGFCLLNDFAIAARHLIERTRRLADSHRRSGCAPGQRHSLHCHPMMATSSLSACTAPATTPSTRRKAPGCGLARRHRRPHLPRPAWPPPARPCWTDASRMSSSTNAVWTCWKRTSWASSP